MCEAWRCATDGRGGLKTCPRCRTRIDTRASRCPQCSADFTKGEMLSGQLEARKAIGGKLFGFLVILVLLVIWMNNGGVEHLVEATAPSPK